MTPEVVAHTSEVTAQDKVAVWLARRLVSWGKSIRVIAPSVQDIVGGQVAVDEIVLEKQFDVAHHLGEKRLI
jgi:hypothetical protein